MDIRRAARVCMPPAWILVLLGGCFNSSEKNGGDASSDPGVEPVEDAVDGACQPAHDFSLEDLNENSPTYEDTRSVSDMVGKVLLIYFANYA
jgi:hypothetical protein